jgi:hypothetical protein
VHSGWIDIGQGVTNTHGFDWNVFQGITQSKDFNWNTLQVITQSKDFDWNTLQQLDSNKTLNWEVHQQVNGNNQLSWDRLLVKLDSHEVSCEVDVQPTVLRIEEYEIYCRENAYSVTL